MAKYQYQIVKEVKSADGGVAETRVVSTASTKREIESRFNWWLRYMKKSEDYGTPIRLGMGWAEGCWYGTFYHESFELFIRRVAI